jgi:hypothetical protein
MIFTPNQTQDFLKIIEANHIFYGAMNIGDDVLTSMDKDLLRGYGIDIDKVKTDYSPFEQSFYWGRLSGALSDLQAKKVTYSNFQNYLKSGQYIPLNQREKDMLDVAKNKTYMKIKDLGKNVASDSNNIILAEARRKVIADSLEQGIKTGDSLKSIVSEIGHKTGDWQRNLGRIVDTEYNNIFQEGRAQQLIRDFGVEVEVYKQVYDGACRHCIRLYLTSGVGSQPIIFKLEDLIANGTNYGLKVVDWKAVVGSTHPHCRCNLYRKHPDKVWDDKKKEFVFPEEHEPMERKKNRLMIGDQEFWV